VGADKVGAPGGFSCTYPALYKSGLGCSDCTFSHTHHVAQFALAHARSNAAATLLGSCSGKRVVMVGSGLLSLLASIVQFVRGASRRRWLIAATLALLLMSSMVATREDGSV